MHKTGQDERNPMDGMKASKNGYIIKICLLGYARAIADCVVVSVGLLCCCMVAGIWNTLKFIAVRMQLVRASLRDA